MEVSIQRDHQPSYSAVNISQGHTHSLHKSNYCVLLLVARILQNPLVTENETRKDYVKLHAHTCMCLRVCGGDTTAAFLTFPMSMNSSHERTP